METAINFNKMNDQSIKIFIVEDDHVFADTVQMFLQNNFNSNFDFFHFERGNDCISNLSRNPHLVIIDLNLPDQSGLELLKKLKAHNPNLKTIILSGQQDVKTAIDVHKIGVDYYILKSPSCWNELENAIGKLSSQIALQMEVENLKEIIIDRNKYSGILGNSPAILHILKMLHKVEKSDISVLVTGETGTGKELIAKTLHYNSPRGKEKFIPINVPAIPEDLIETELFGHVKGAFTGAANKRIGKFEEADGGTIFLDEIGEMNLDLQSKLLRVLEEKEVVRVGTNKIIHTDVRVVSSTNRDLAEEIKEGRFREDLYYRLNGIQIHLPPLRERGDDIILLAKNFLKIFCKNNSLPDIILQKDAIHSLMHYSWPGNVRELKSIMERSALLADSTVISKEDIAYNSTNTPPIHLRKTA